MLFSRATIQMILCSVLVVTQCLPVSSYDTVPNDNTGLTGPGNNGWNNVGSPNTGDDNIGHHNIGDENTGNHNTGSYNVGSGNVGDDNVGDANYGDVNNGNNNTGNWNEGNGNIGDANVGNNNDGNWNEGNSNIGDGNVGNANNGDWNSGNSNTGDGNVGNSNQGDWNNGHSNIGDGNVGNANNGDWNNGNQNTGNWNNGDGNLGDANNGNYNNGDWNNGNHNTGNGNVGDRNNGSWNTGNANVGDENVGNGNIGDQNQGNYNTGNANIGDSNIGSGNVGSNNFGSSNYGILNRGSYNVGALNQGLGNIGINNIGIGNLGQGNLGMFNRGTGHVGNNNEDELILESNLVPILWGWFSKSTRISANAPVQEKNFSALTRTIFASLAPSQFEVVKTIEYNFGAGLANVYHYPRAGDVYKELVGRGFGLGLTFSRDTRLIYKKVFETHPEYKHYRFEFPNTVAKLKTWKAGDQLQYFTEGGVHLSAFAAQGMAGVGSMLALVGKFQNRIRILDNQLVELNLKTTEVHKASLYAGSAFMSVAAEKAREASREFQYIADLKEPVIANAVEDFVNGNAAPLQTLADTNAGGVMRVWLKQNSSRSSNFGIRAGIPFVPFFKFDWGLKNIIENSITLNYQQGVLESLDSASYLENSSTSLFGYNRSAVHGFQSSINSKLTQENPQIVTNNVGYFFYLNEDDSTHVENLNERIKKLVNLTDLREYFDAHVAIKGNLGYVKVAAFIYFSNNLYRYLADQLMQTGNLNKIEASADQLLREYLVALAGNSRMPNYCLRHQQPEKGRSTPAQGYTCYQILHREIKNAIAEVRSLLIQANFQSLSGKKLAKLYAQVGQAALKSKFVFKALFYQAKQCGARLSFSVTGEKIVPFSILEEFTAQPSCYGKVTSNVPVTESAPIVPTVPATTSDSNSTPVNTAPVNSTPIIATPTANNPTPAHTTPVVPSPVSSTPIEGPTNPTPIVKVPQTTPNLPTPIADEEPETPTDIVTLDIKVPDVSEVPNPIADCSCNYHCGGIKSCVRLCKNQANKCAYLFHEKMKVVQKICEGDLKCLNSRRFSGQNFFKTSLKKLLDDLQFKTENECGFKG